LVLPNYVFTKIEEIRKEWLLSVNIKPFGLFDGKIQNIIYMKADNGDQVFKVGLIKDTTKLSVEARVNEEFITLSFTSPYDNLPMDQYSTFKAYQIYNEVLAAYIIEVVVNGIPLVSMVNPQPKVFKDVNVYTNSPSGIKSKVYFKSLYTLNIE